MAPIWRVESALSLKQKHWISDSLLNGKRLEQVQKSVSTSESATNLIQQFIRNYIIGNNFISISIH